MNYFLDYNGRVIGPMTAMQVMGYNPTYDVRVSLDGVNWQPLYTFPELMSLYNERSKYGEQQQTDSKKTLCTQSIGIFKSQKPWTEKNKSDEHRFLRACCCGLTVLAVTIRLGSS